MAKKLWHPAPNSSIMPQSRQPAARQGFTGAAVRKMATYDSRKQGANFKCPACKVYFYLTYGRFGKFRTFEQPTYYCTDCSKKDGFVKC